MNKEEMIQSVTLKLSDGTVGTFVGPALVFEESARIVDVTFGPPRPMPTGCEWGKIDTEEHDE
jgi:hypothetical protein